MVFPSKLTSPGTCREGRLVVPEDVAGQPMNDDHSPRHCSQSISIVPNAFIQSGSKNLVGGEGGGLIFTINGAESQPHPRLLVTPEYDQSDQVPHRRQHDAQTRDHRFGHEQLEDVLLVGERAGAAERHGAGEELEAIVPAEAVADLVRHREIEDREAHVEEHVVGEQRDERLDGEPDLAVVAGVGGDEHHGRDEGEDGDGAEAACDDHDAGDPVGVAQFAQAPDRRGALQEEEVDDYLGGDVPSEAQVDGAAADVVALHLEDGQVYSVAEEEQHRGEVCHDGEDALECELAELSGPEDVESSC